METKKKYYTEEELVEKVQSGVFTLLDYVTRSSEQQTKEFRNFCNDKGLEENEESAMEYLDYRDEQFNNLIDE